VDTGAGQGSAGGIGSSPDGNPHVNLYARVDDAKKYLKRAESLGGKAIMQPTEVGAGTTIAMLQDPQGTTFGLYVHRD
jgi:predicted enzyme related to lactoylglutathione lyase